MKPVAIALTLVAATSGASAPSSLLASTPAPGGFELASEPPIDMTFEEYAPLAPDATAHVEPDGEAARSMRAAVDVWTSPDDDILLREVTRWGSDADAQAFVEQAVVVGTEDGLDRVEPPFGGGTAFFGAEDGLWTRTVSWRQGPYGMTVAHFGISEGDFGVIDAAATELAAGVTEVAGHPVEVVAVGQVPAETSSGGGIGLGTVVLWIVVVGGVMWSIARLRRRAGDRGRSSSGPARHGDDVPTDVDDLTERARARGPTRRESDNIRDPGRTPPTDD